MGADENKASAKTRKKAAKSQGKAEKKRAKLAADGSPSSTNRPASAADPQGPRGQQMEKPSPQERSALAAERQVRLQRLRVVIALVMLLIALGTFLLMVKPWHWLGE